jgi:DNA primase
LDGLIPDEALDRVRSATDIVELVSQHVTLKHTGANYLGLCPFHQEKTPSFTVSPSKQIFHCFGCGAGGDAVGFMMRQGNYSFPEAVRFLADRAGIELPERAEKTFRDDRERLYQTNLEAAKFYQDRLWNSIDGKKAVNYLEERGMPPEVAKKFEIGYSPASWDALISHLKGKGLSAPILEKAGLAIKKADSAGYYDRFRGRLMFPIRDIKDRVIGFGGRAMNKDEMPKYLNSPETPLFNKSETLYGINIAKDTIRSKNFTMVVEGYMDAIACHRAGIGNTVATLGTALTFKHLRVLSRFSKNILLVFDSDEAGIKASERTLDHFLGSDMTVKVALLPKGDDPDSLLKREGTKKLKEKLSSSENLIDFVLKNEIEKIQSDEDKSKIAKKLTTILINIKDPFERSAYFAKISDQLGIDESVFPEEIRKRVRKQPQLRAVQNLNKIETQLLQIALQVPEEAQRIYENLPISDFTDQSIKYFFEIIYGVLENNDELKIQKILDSLDKEDEKKFILALSLQDSVDDTEGFVNGYMDKVSKGRDLKRLSELQALIKSAEENNDIKHLNTLQKELVEWQKKKSWTKSNS